MLGLEKPCPSRSYRGRLSLGRRFGTTVLLWNVSGRPLLVPCLRGGPHPGRGAQAARGSATGVCVRHPGAARAEGRCVACHCAVVLGHCSSEWRLLETTALRVLSRVPHDTKPGSLFST